MKRVDKLYMFGECHAHFLMNGFNYREAVEANREQACDSLIKNYFESCQKRGVIFVQDGGDSLGVSKRAAALARQYGIDYRTPIFAIHKNGNYGSIVGNGFDTMKEYHELVCRVSAEGGDFIKIMVSGIVDFREYGKITGTSLKDGEIKEMIYIAHEEGLSVMVHVNGSKAFQSAVAGGADSVEHGNYIDRECIEALSEHKAVWVPTLVTIKNLLGSGRYEDRIVRKIYEENGENIRYAYEKGADLALGSDAGAYRVLHGQGIVDEYQAFLELFDENERQGLTVRLNQGEHEIKKRFCVAYRK